MKILLERWRVPVSFIISSKFESSAEEIHLFPLTFIICKNFNILLERYFIPLIIINFQEFEDFVGKRPYPNDMYYFLRIWRFCWKDTLSHWHILFIRSWRFCWRNTFPHWYLLIFKNLKILLERYLILLKFIIFLLRNWGFCWKDSLSHWRLLLWRI